MSQTLKVLILSLLAAATVHAAPSNEELKIGLSQEFENLNPIIKTMNATTYILGATNQTLDTIDPDGKWVPMLVKTIPTFENKLAKFSPDKKQVISTWEIKENAKWGDGTPVTCEDIAFSVKVGTHPTVSVGEKEVYSQFAKIDIDPKNPKKCTVTSDKLRWDFNHVGTLEIVPKHLEEPVFEKFKDQKEGYEKNSNYTKNPTNPGLYNGPYMVSEVKLGSHVTIVPNPHFYGKPAKIKKVIFKLIPNTGTLEANLRSGTIDMISILGLTFDQAVSFDKKGKSENLPYDTQFKTGLTYEHVDLNLDNPILKDLKVRKALVYALNREELVKALFEGKQPVAIHNINPIDPWYTKDPKDVVLYPYSKREAARLFDEAGWKLNAADGIRYKDGKKLTFQFNTTAGNKVRETVQTFLQGQWKQVGVEVTIKNEPARVFFAETTRKRNFEAMAMYAWISSPENTPKSTSHSSMISSEKNGYSGQNYPGWNNKKVDQLIEQLDGEFDHKKRVKIIAQYLKFYTDEVPVIPLYYRAETATIPKNLKGFRLTGHQFSDTLWLNEWSL